MDYSRMAGRRLARARRDKGLSVEDLCGRVPGLEPERLRDFENGHSYPPSHLLRRLAAQLGEFPDFLGALDIKHHRFAITAACGQQEYALQRIGHHIRARMKDRGLEPRELAGATGMPEDRLQAILLGREDGSVVLMELAKALDCSVAELLCGCFRDTQADYSRLGGLVPLTSWEDAAAEKVDMAPPPELRVCCPLPHQAGCYALRLEDAQMEAPGLEGRAWRIGDVIFVDPARRHEAGEGDPVVARLQPQGKAVFRLLARGPAGWKLTSPNAAAQRHQGELEILGLVLGSWHMLGDEF